VPIVCISPILRPDAEDTPNALGATLADLRSALECAAEACDVRLVAGRDLVSASHLTDGIHPGDEGHAMLAKALGPTLSQALGEGARPAACAAAAPLADNRPC
jgi:hypothetical protein